MLTVYLPRGNALELQSRSRRPIPGMPRSGSISSIPTTEEDKLVERLVGIADPDPRGDAGDRGLQPALCRERRALHDGDADVPVRHAGRRRPRRSPSSSPDNAWSRCATTSRGRSRSIRHKLGKSCPPNITGQTVLMDLLDAVIDRTADILERIGAEVDQCLARDFRAQAVARQARRVTTTHPAIDRPQGRPHLEGAREPGLDRPAGAVPRQRRRGRCAGRRKCARSSRPCSATCSRCPTTPPI